jgi:DNA-binding transcriptional LysR family regulator
MDWRGISFDWTRVRAFLVTAEEGSLSAAARALGLTQPTLGRQVQALEEELGVTLFTRAGRRMELTESGLSLIDHARAMGAAAAQLSLAASGRSREIAGEVTVTASDLYAAELLPPVVARLRDEAPGLRVSILPSNAVRDLMRREADIAIRHVRPEQPDLTARLVCEDEARLYGTPGCLAPFQPLASPRDLRGVPFIGFDETATYLRHLNDAGIPATQDSFAAITADHHAQWALCKAGVGLVAVPSWLGDAEPAVIRALPGPEPLVRFPVWLVAHREVHNSARVRLVFDRLSEALARLGGERDARSVRNEERT